MKSNFFYGGHYQAVAASIEDYINSVPEFLSAQTARSTRAAGDAIEGLIADRFDTGVVKSSCSRDPPQTPP
ncbi:MAG: hypothetical protein EBE86_029355 [Hormoscilla sp. GUM202]|nr:hypothetical protein [Hormoscilla sp. GUM202]